MSGTPSPGPAGRGPLGALAGVPGLTGALVRAALAALAQTAGLVLLAAGLAHAVARVTGHADGGVAAPLVLATAGVVLRAVADRVYFPTRAMKTGTSGRVIATRTADSRSVQARTTSSAGGTTSVCASAGR